MPDFAERLARLAELSTEELTSLETEIVDAFNAADDSSDIDAMQKLADMLDQVRAELSTREDASANADTPPAEAPAPAPAEVAASASTPKPIEASSEPETTQTTTTEVEVETETTETPDGAESDEAEGDTADAESESDTSDAPDTESADTDAADASDTASEDDAPADESPDTDTTPEPTGSTNNESEEQVATQITAQDVPDENAPVAAAAPLVSIRAGGDIPGITAGSELSDMDAVVEALTRKVNAMRGVSGNGEQLIVASLQHPDAGETRTLRAGDLEGNSRKIRALVSDPEAMTPEALVAGGWCAPRQPIYDVPSVGTTERPVASALPTFRADRGGITWVAPPTLPGFELATSLWRYNGTAWRAYTDPRGTVPASPVDEKPCMLVECGNEYSVDVDAVPYCLTFDNMTARAFPEWVRATTELTMVAQARFAEQKSLAQLFSLAATGTAGTITTPLGVARDFLRGVRIAAAAKRHQHRMSETAPLQLLAPRWLATAIAVDLGLGEEFQTVSLSEVDGHLRELNIQPIWYIDNVPGQTDFESSTALPTVANWLLFPAGTYVRLDNGELNLGVVRTKEDIKKNRYTEFSETFETIAHFGPEDFSWTVKGATPVNLLGSYSAPKTVV